MTSIDITPTLPVFRPATRLRLTVRGRRVLALVASLPLIVALAFTALQGISATAAAEASAVSFETITVLPGDTLWAIASELAPASDPRDVVTAIMGLNQLGSAELQVGQRLALPHEYAPAP